MLEQTRQILSVLAIRLRLFFLSACFTPIFVPEEIKIRRIKCDVAECLHVRSRVLWSRLHDISEIFYN